MNNFTPAQQKVIETWTEKRDSLLSEIGILQTQLDTQRKELTDGGLSLDELHRSIAEAQGRLAEITALEERYKESVSKEVAELETRKSRLEAECTAKEKEKEQSNSEITRINNAITTLSEAHDKMAEQAAIVNRVVGEITETSTAHVSETKTILAEVRTVANEVIEKGNENVKQTNIVLEQLPRFIFEMQRPIPVRRYAEARTKSGVDQSIIDEVRESNQSLKE